MEKNNVKVNQLREEKTLATSEGKDLLSQITEVKDLLDRSTEEHQEQNTKLDKLYTEIVEIKASYAKLESGVDKLIQSSEQSAEREKRMLDRVKPAWYVTFCGTPFGDFVIDSIKEVVKAMVGDERFEACGNAIKALLEPLFSPVSGMIPLLPLVLKIATAAVILLVATFFLNHTAKVWTPIRSGLARLRNMFASKK